MEKRSSLTQGSIPKAILGIAFPTWGAFFSQDLLGIVDMLFVGRLGPEAVAAVAMANVMFGIIIMIGQGVSSGTMALVANTLGAGNRRAAEGITAQSLCMCLLLGLLVGVSGLLGARQALGLLGASEGVAAVAEGYLRIVLGGAMIMLLTMVLGSTLRAAGDARVPFVAMVTGNAVNIALDPVLIFGWGSIPALGVSGAAWATIIGRTFGLILIGWVFLSPRYELLQLHMREMRPRLSVMKKIAGIGVFASARMLMRNTADLLLMKLVAMFGTDAVAGYGIVMRLQFLVFGPSMGFGTAAAAMVGQNLGMGNPERAERATWVSAAMVCAVVGLLSLSFWMGAGRLIQIFTADTQVILIGANLLRWLSFSFIFLSLALVLGQGMTGGGDTLYPMIIIGITLILIGVPLAYGVAKAWGSVQGVWAALACSNVLAGLLSVYAFCSGRWRTIGERIRETMQE